MEWNTGPHGHTVTVVSPVNAIAGTNKDGSAYLEIGMTSEAEALDAALSVIRNSENDYDDEATEAAYKSVSNKFSNDELKNQALLEFFRSRTEQRNARRNSRRRAG